MINLDKLRADKRDALMRLLYPTKRETAEHHAMYFHSPTYQSWWCFKPSMTPVQQQSIYEVVQKLIGE